MAREALFGRFDEDLGGIRIRSREISRLEGMTDAALGFAITLLIVSQEVPNGYTKFVDMLWTIPSFAITFLLIMLIWYWHNRFFRRYGLVNGRVVALSSALMFFVLVMVFPLKFMTTALINQLLFVQTLDLPGAPVLITDWAEGGLTLLHTAFVLGFAAVFLCMAALYAEAYRMRVPLELTLKEEIITRGTVVIFIIVAGIALLTILPSVLLPPWPGGPIAGFSLILITPATDLYGKRIKRQLAQLEEEGDGPAPSA